MSIRVALVDDHELIREGIKNLLNNCPGISLVGEYSKGVYLLNGLRNDLPDVILLDLQLPDQHGEELLPVIKQTYPDIKVIILTTNENIYNIKKLLNIGADGYIFKNTDSKLLAEGINHVIKESTPFLPEYVRQSIKRKTSTLDKNISLTPREMEVLRLSALEHTSKEIGDILQINHRTVEIFRRGIMQKLDANNMVGVVKKAIMLGLIKE